jgi:hypothetical protein
MPKITRPKSVFGKLPYIKEHMIIRSALYDIIVGSVFVNPTIVGYPVPMFLYTERLPVEKRRQEALKLFTKAKNQLDRVL